jgi:hypothetical protein
MSINQRMTIENVRYVYIHAHIYIYIYEYIHTHTICIYTQYTMKYYSIKLNEVLIDART